MLSNFDLLLGGLFQQPLGHHILHIGLGNAHLLKAILHPTHRFCHKAKAGVVKQGLLQAPHKPKPRIFTNFAHFPQKAQV